MLSDRIFDDPESIDKNALEVVQRDFFDGNPVTIDVGIEGQRLDREGGNYVLGCRAGPGIHISNLYHEMSHLAEREIAKLLEKPNRNWGYGWGQYWEIAGQSGFEYQTDQSVQREKRVWAYQLSIEKHYGIYTQNIKNDNAPPEVVLARIAPFLPAFPLYIGRQGLKDEKAAIQFLADEIRELSETAFTFKHFCDAWFERMKALK
jgi:hypothetical protein